jgi:3',5'-nucleoside bisphosphate phosphatase
MQTYRAELHVHTVLSPCASVEMIPPLIVQAAIECGIRLIAITDHNTSANVAAVMKAADQSGLVVLPGMELQTREEVHLLCLFDNLEKLLAWQVIVDQYLPDIQNNSEYFGEQFIVDETGDFLGIEPRLLISSVQLTLEQAIQQVHALGGLAIPAHIDRKAFGLIENLGMIPTDLPMDALEISRHMTADLALKKYPQAADFPLLQSGDVHHLEDFLGSSYFSIEAPTLTEIQLAFHQAMGRKMEINQKI